MYLEVWIVIVGKNWKGSISSASANFEESDGAIVCTSNLIQNWKFLLQPFSVFEEVCSIILVEVVPPFRGVGIKPVFCSR